MSGYLDFYAIRPTIDAKSSLLTPRMRPHHAESVVITR